MVSSVITTLRCGGNLAVADLYALMFSVMNCMYEVIRKASSSLPAVIPKKLRKYSYFYEYDTRTAKIALLPAIIITQK